jgi:hypothetical protein
MGRQRAILKKWMNEFMDKPVYSNIKKAIITGGSSGIGKVLLIDFAGKI